MFRILTLLPLCCAVLSACGRDVPAPVGVPRAQSSTRPAAIDAGNLSSIGQARIDGYGHLRFGMTAEQAKHAWGGELNGAPGPGEICYYLTPTTTKTPRDFGVMIESDKFVRYDVRTDKDIAPGGGRQGMDAGEIRKLYAGRFTQAPHKYVTGGSYLRIKSNDAIGGVLLFETGADGKVTTWRVGQAPQVDYVEGCS